MEGIRKIDLTGKNLTAHIPSDIKVGEWVNVIMKTDNDGHKTVTVEHSKHEAARR